MRRQILMCWRVEIVCFCPSLCKCSICILRLCVELIVVAWYKSPPIFLSTNSFDPVDFAHLWNEIHRSRVIDKVNRFRYLTKQTTFWHQAVVVWTALFWEKKITFYSITIYLGTFTAKEIYKSELFVLRSILLVSN